MCLFGCKHEIPMLIRMCHHLVHCNKKPFSQLQNILRAVTIYTVTADKQNIRSISRVCYLSPTGWYFCDIIWRALLFSHARAPCLVYESWFVISLLHLIFTSRSLSANIYLAWGKLDLLFNCLYLYVFASY